MPTKGDVSSVKTPLGGVEPGILRWAVFLNLTTKGTPIISLSQILALIPATYHVFIYPPVTWISRGVEICLHICNTIAAVLTCRSMTPMRKRCSHCSQEYTEQHRTESRIELPHLYYCKEGDVNRLIQRSSKVVGE